MADLSQLFKNAPGTAAYMTGAQQASDQQTDKLRQQQLMELINELRQKQQQSAQQFPLELEHARTRNESLRAGIPGITASGRAQELSNQATEQTQPGAIAATNATNADRALAAQAAVSDRMGKIFRDLGPEVSNLPAPLRAAYALTKLKTSGVDEKHPMYEQYSKAITSQDPEQLPKMFEGIAKTYNEQNLKYQTSLDAVTKRSENLRTVTNMKIEAQRQADALKAELALRLKQMGVNSKAGTKDPLASARTATALHAQLVDQGTKALLAGNTEEAQAYFTRANAQANQAVAELDRTTGKTDVESATKGRIQPPAKPVIAPQLPPGAPSPTVPPPSESTGSGEIISKLKAGGIPYEPNKYLYRISPDGKIQRKAK